MMEVLNQQNHSYRDAQETSIMSFNAQRSSVLCFLFRMGQYIRTETQDKLLILMILFVFSCIQTFMRSFSIVSTKLEDQARKIGNISVFLCSGWLVLMLVYRRSHSWSVALLIQKNTQLNISIYFAQSSMSHRNVCIFQSFVQRLCYRLVLDVGSISFNAKSSAFADFFGDLRGSRPSSRSQKLICWFRFCSFLQF